MNRPPTAPTTGPQFGQALMSQSVNVTGTGVTIDPSAFFVGSDTIGLTFDSSAIYLPNGWLYWANLYMPMSLPGGPPSIAAGDWLSFNLLSGNGYGEYLELSMVNQFEGMAGGRLSTLTHGTGGQVGGDLFLYGPSTNLGTTFTLLAVFMMITALKVS